MIRGYGPKKPAQKKKRGDRPEIPFQRVSAEIMIEATKEVAEGRVFLNDLTPTGVGCFVNMSLDKGEEIAIVIEQPKHLYVKGRVAWCQPYTLDTKVLTAERFEYRVGIQFIFDSPEEAEAIKQYCADLYAPKKAA